MFTRSTANISTDLYMALIEKGEGETFKNLKGSEKFQKGGIVAKKKGLQRRPAYIIHNKKT